MRATDRYEFKTLANHRREGMLAASQALLKGRRSVVSILITMCLIVLSGFGGITVVMFIVAWFGLDPTWWAFVGWCFGAGLHLYSFKLLSLRMANLIAQRAFNQAPQSITFDEDGMTYEASPAIWKTPWAFVDGIIETKGTITISVSGMAFSIPKSAIGNSTDVMNLIDDLNAQIDNA